QIESERLHYTECEAEAIHGPLFAVPASPSDSSTPQVYTPGEMWVPTNPTSPKPVPMPPAPQGTSPHPTPGILPAPPMSDSDDAVQGASHQRSGTSGTPPRPPRKPKSPQKGTILDTFHREKP